MTLLTVLLACWISMPFKWNSASVPWLVAETMLVPVPDDSSFNCSVVAPVAFACNDK